MVRSSIIELLQLDIHATCINGLLSKISSRTIWSNSYTELIQQLTMVKTVKEQELYRYALFSAYSYCSSKNVFSEYNLDLNDVPITGTFKLLLDTTQYYIAQTRNQVVVAFKGSTLDTDFDASIDQTLNYISDSIILKSTSNNILECDVNDQGLYYFRGFWNSVSKKELDQISKIVRDKSNIVVTGHSLGGVKAMITAYYLRKFHKQTPRVFTYSQPIIGSVGFNDYLAACIGEENITRVISENDLIPFIRSTKEINHATKVKVIYSYNHSLSDWKECLGPLNPNCGSNISCKDKSLDYHNWFAGLRIDDQVCEF